MHFPVALGPAHGAASAVALRHCSPRYLTHRVSFDSPDNPEGDHSGLTDVHTEAQRGEVICPKLHSWHVMELGSEP